MVSTLSLLQLWNHGIHATYYPLWFTKRVPLKSPSIHQVGAVGHIGTLSFCCPTTFFWLPCQNSFVSFKHLDIELKWRGKQRESLGTKLYVHLTPPDLSLSLSPLPYDPFLFSLKRRKFPCLYAATFSGSLCEGNAESSYESLVGERVDALPKVHIFSERPV